MARHHRAFNSKGIFRVLQPSPINGVSLQELNQRAIAALERGEVPTAEFLLEQALKLDGSNSTLLNNLAIVFIKGGSPDRALDVLTRAYRSIPADRSIALNLVLVAESLGRNDITTTVSREFLERAPGDPDFVRFVQPISLSKDSPLQHLTPLTGSWAQQAPYVRVGRNVIFGSGSYLDVRHRPDNLGVRVNIGDESQIFGGCVILTPTAEITIGARTQVGASRLMAAQRISIGDDVLMAWNVTITDSDVHSFDWRERSAEIARMPTALRTHPHDPDRARDWGSVSAAPIRIGDRAWIGFNVIISKGVTIGDGAIIGAGSVVTTDIPPYCIAAGNPAKVLRELPLEGR